MLFSLMEGLTMDQQRLLITGFSGRIGSILWQQLADSYRLYGVDVCIAQSGEQTFRADIANYEQLTSVFRRIAPLTFIIHLAADPRVDADWHSVLMNNIIATRNVYEAAREFGVRRVIFASSNHVTGAYEGFPPALHTHPAPPLITTSDPLRPDGFYGVSKIFGEAIARMYYELYGIESICLRIGSVLEDDDPMRNERQRSTWLSHRDLVQLVKKSLIADVQFGIYYGVSDNRRRFWDISNAQAELGYQPEDDAARL
ncbi:MAG: NAD-dependent epimerase [Herpetosiphonaceae bacterium]|nr:MAG: NAD-dependent epimerase [Herpetosiphonaceae bacterium]